MSRSPVSPAGKKLRTMDHEDNFDKSSPSESRPSSSLQESFQHHDDSISNSLDKSTEPGPSFLKQSNMRSSSDKEPSTSAESTTSSSVLTVATSQSSRWDPDEVIEHISQDDGNESVITEDDMGIVQNLDADLLYLSGEGSSSGYEDIWVLRDTDGSDDSDDDDEENLDEFLPDEYLKHDPTPDTPYPRPDWITIKELQARKCGFASAMKFPRRQDMYWFQRYASNSLWMIQRMQKTRKLQGHNGCVNSLDFSSSGNLLCSGSNDLTVNIWDWRLKTGNKQGDSLLSGHVSNILQTQFCNQDRSIITSSRDGSVRLIDIERGRSEPLMSSSSEIGQIVFTSPQTLLTCGTNANVNLIDLRTGLVRTLFTVTNQRNRRCPLHTISSHPLDTHVIAVAGLSPSVYLYDLRRIPRDLNHSEVKPTYCLGNLDNQEHMVTSTAFNSIGDKLLISYNDDDLYVCNTKTCEIIHKYTGHRNKKTIKGCAWFGDNYVLSGSDDGHIYGWDLESEHIVCFLEGDEMVVNCIKVHPRLPILATSGIEHDIKIWEPHANIWPQTMKGIKPQICRNTLRRKRAKREQQMFENHLASLGHPE